MTEIESLKNEISELSNKLNLVLSTLPSLVAALSPSKVKGCSFYEWVDIWLEKYKKPKLKKSSYRNIVQIIKNHIKPIQEDINIRDLKAVNIENILNHISFSRTKKYAYTILHDCLKQAYKNDLLDKDLSEKINKVTHVYTEGKALSVSKRKKLFDYAIKSKNYILAFYLFSGARRIELLTLEDSHLHSSTVALPGTKTKTSFREIPKFKILENILNLVKNENIKSKLVFGVSDTKLKFMVNEARKVLKFKFCIKDLRTTFATMCQEKGIDLNVIAKWMGHTNTNTTNKYYVKILEDYEKQEIQKLTI